MYLHYLQVSRSHCPPLRRKSHPGEGHLDGAVERNPLSEKQLQHRTGEHIPLRIGSTSHSFLGQILSVMMQEIMPVRNRASVLKCVPIPLSGIGDQTVGQPGRPCM